MLIFFEKGQKFAWVEARELKIGMKMLCYLKDKSVCWILEILEIRFRNS
jgi:hypothetical protein